MKHLKNHFGLSVFLLSQLAVSVAFADVIAEGQTPQTKSPFNIKLLGGGQASPAQDSAGIASKDSAAKNAQPKAEKTKVAGAGGTATASPEVLKPSVKPGATNSPSKAKPAEKIPVSKNTHFKESPAKEKTKDTQNSKSNSSPSSSPSPSKKNETAKNGTVTSAKPMTPSQPMNPSQIEQQVKNIDPKANYVAPKKQAHKRHKARRHTMTGQVTPAAVYPEVIVRPNEQVCLSGVQGRFETEGSSSRQSPAAAMTIAHDAANDTVERAADGDIVTKMYSINLAIYSQDRSQQAPVCVLSGQVAGDLCAYGSALRVNLAQGCQIRLYPDSTQNVMRIRYNEACLTNLCGSAVKWQDIYFSTSSR